MSDVLDLLTKTHPTVWQLDEVILHLVYKLYIHKRCNHVHLALLYVKINGYCIHLKH